MTKRGRLRPGDVVEVRAPAEILATLDDASANGEMPFMPEMLPHVGRRFVVSRRVEKICDTAGKVSGHPSISRRLRDTVYLDDLRCDGSGHGGCQAGCRLYWREEWLRPVGSGDVEAGDVQTDPARAELARVAARATKVRVVDGEKKEIFRCQATQVRIASEPLSASDPRQHVREVVAGNVSAGHVVSVLGRYGLERAATYARMTASRLLTSLHLRSRKMPTDSPGGTVQSVRTSEDLQPGDVVRIRPLEEIESTLVNGRYRGLWFDVPEMSTFCGGTFIVKDRVRRFIDDHNGEMIELKTDCLILDGVCCTGEHSSRRWFCPRGIYSFWREDWLELVERATPSQVDASVGDSSG
jgi:hypothetical protein